ncbi:MAG: insulinase family protein [Gemmatimonadota bacterium]|nr:insulinase family protein [Gemmatimonadota bacterium]
MNQMRYDALRSRLLVRAAWLAALALSAAAGLPAAAQDSARAGPPPKLTAPLPKDPAVTIGVLPNGLRYYIRVNHKPEKRAELRLVVNAGSVLEDSSQRGLAHMVEHMAFSGTTHFKKQELVDYLESTGVRFGADLNASTSFDETIYELTVPTDSTKLFDKGFQILAEWSRGLTFDSTELARERNVVIEEWRLGRGASARMRDKQFPIIFSGSRYAQRLPIGDKHTLETAPRATVKRFYDEWYRPDLMAVVAVGDFDKTKVERLIRAQFACWPAKKGERPRLSYPVPDHDSTLVTIATDSEATRSTVAVYYLQPLRLQKTVGDFRERMIGSLYNEMLNARLQEIAQRPGAPFIGAFSNQGQLIRSKEVYVLTALVPDSGVETGLRAVVTEGERVAQHGFTATELDRAKKDMLRGMESAYAERDKTPSGSFVSEYVSAFLEHTPTPSIAQEYTLYQQLIPGIQLSEVNALAHKWLSNRSRVIVVNAPQKAGGALPSEAALRAVLDSAAHVSVAAYTDSVSNAPLVPTLPTAGKVVSSTYIASVGVTEWKLSNGARVLVKPTDFKDDELLFRAYAAGGTSVVSDSDYLDATIATAAVDAGGIGAFSATQLQKALAGKDVQVGEYIGAIQQGMSGGGSPKDLKTLIQLIYLTFTVPRADSAAFEAYRNKIEVLLANRAASPSAAFSDTLDLTLSQHHFRAKPPTAQDMEYVRLHHAISLYKQRFADASNFTFIFVGTIDTTKLKPLVEQYIGSLPSTHAAEKWKDVGMSYPTGVITREVKRGIEPKSQTAIVFTGPFDFTWENVQQISALSDLLEIKLRERLRQDLGGTYGVGVSANPAHFPKETYALRIDFGSAPERANELQKAVFAEIDSVKDNGVSEKDLQKIREADLRARETSLRQNRTWLSLLASYDVNGWDPSLILKYDENVRALSSSSLQATARKYFDMSRYVVVQLLPAH